MSRVTNSMMADTFMRNYYKNLSRLDKMYDRAEKRVKVPSDDPVAAAGIIKLYTGRNELAQYERNVQDAKIWMDFTESALGEAGDILHRIRELTVHAANGDKTVEARKADAEEVRQLRDQLVVISNSTYQGRYIFAGTNTMSKAYDNDGTYNGNDKDIEYEIAQAETIVVSYPGNKVFGETDSSDIDAEPEPKHINLFKDLDRLIKDMEDGNLDRLSSEHLESMDYWHDNITNHRAEVGVKTNRLDFAANRMKDENLSMKALLSNLEDKDLAEAIMEMKVLESVYTASLAVGSRVLQPSLVDFLR